MKNQLPKISIVVPSYNQGPYLHDALESIFSQEYPNLEVVIMDGGSNDNSMEIIHAYKTRLKYWQSQADSGQASAINEGMQYCSGEIVSWLNSDDWYINDSFWIIARAYQENSGSGLFIGNGFRYKGGEYKPFCPRHIAISREVLREGLDYILQPATFMSREAWLQSGGLNVDLHYGLDWDLFIRILEKQSAVAINEFLAVSREHDQTKTSSGQLTRAQELINIADQSIHKSIALGPAYYLMTGAINEFLAITKDYDKSNTSSNPLINDLLNIVTYSSQKTVTMGSAYYLLEALLGIDPKLGGFPEEARHPIHRTMLRIQNEMNAMWGTPDPFPIRADEQDKVFIPFAKGLNSYPKSFQDIQNPPKISIIIPSYNQAEFLSKTLESIINQNYPALEVIVMDGGSSDKSVDVIKKYTSQLTYWKSEADLGPAHALNKGFAKATGDIVGWLNSDDVLTEGSLWHIAQEFVRNPKTEVVFGNALYIEEQDQLFLADHGTHRTGLYYGKLEPMSNVPYYWTYVHAIPQPTVYFRRHLIQKVGGVDQSYHFIFDFEFFWRLRNVVSFKKIERTMALYRIHSHSKTSDWNKFLPELFRFSRPLWPARNTIEYKTVLSSLTNQYFSRKYGSYRRRNFFEKQIIKFIIANQIINLEVFASSAFLSIVRKRLLHYVSKLLRRFAQYKAEKKPFIPSLPEIPLRENLEYSVLDQNKKYTITFCSFIYPRHPGHSGGEIRDFHILRKLLSISSLDFFAIWTPPASGRRDDLRPYFRQIYDSEILNSYLPNLVDKNALHLSRKARLLLWLRNKNIPVYGPKYHNEFATFAPFNKSYILRGLNQIQKVYQPDFLIIGPQPNPLPLQLSDMPAKTRLILSSYDVEAIRLERMAASKKGLARQALQLEAYRAQSFESDTLKHYDGVIAVSNTDKQSYIQRYQLEPDRVLVLDNSVDTQYFSFRPRIKTHQPNIVFIGSLGYWPNDEAAQLLLKEIMPLVRQVNPTTRAWIVGQSPSMELLALSDGVLNIVTGQVDDVRIFLDMAIVSCIPLRTGSGTKYKVLEAASAGAPIVCTPLALEGLSLKPDEHVLVGESHNELADAITNIIQNPDAHTRAVRNASAHVEKYYSWNSNLHKLEPWLEAIQKMPKRGH